MPAIGNRTVNLFRVDSDATTYIGDTHTVSHTDKVDLRRTLPANGNQPMRTNARFERGFAVQGSSSGVEAPVVVSVAVTVPPGTVAADVETFIGDTLTQAIDTIKSLAVTGDIHL